MTRRRVVFTLVLTTVVAGLLVLICVLSRGGGGRVIHVSPTGDDTASGSSAAPLATVHRALDLAVDGDTVRLAAGTYREGELIMPNRVRLEAGRGEKVVLSGAQVVQDWVAEGSVWRSRDELVRFCQECTFNPDPGYDGVRGYPEQVYLDGVALRQVASREEVVEGTFFVDRLPVEFEGGGIDRIGRVTGSRTAHYLLGSDPSGHQVEVVQHARALTVAGNGAAVANLTIEKYAPTQMWGLQDPQIGTQGSGTMVLVMGDDVSIESTVLRQATSGSALHFTNGSGQSLTSSKVMDNAGAGMMANETYNLLVSRSYFTGNNANGFDSAETCGAYCYLADFKITHSAGLRFELNTLDYADREADAADPLLYSTNRQVGVWLDEGVANSTVVGNYFVNTPVAVFNEISLNTVIASNVINGAGTGILSSGSERARIWNNTVAYALEPLVIREDARTDGCNARTQDGTCVEEEPWSVQHELTWDQTDTEVFNNIFTSKQTARLPQDPWRFSWHAGVLAGGNWDGTAVGANDMVLGMDYNVYYRQPAAEDQPSFAVLWQVDQGRSITPQTLEGLTNDPAVTANEREQNGWELLGPRGANPLVVRESRNPRDYAASDFRLREDSPARGTGKAVFGDTAKALGLEERTVVDRGALFNVAWGTASWQADRQEGAAASATGATAAGAPEQTGAEQATASGAADAGAAAGLSQSSGRAETAGTAIDRQPRKALGAAPASRLLLDMAGALFISILVLLVLLVLLGRLFQPARPAPQADKQPPGRAGGVQDKRSS
ncbi:right-handed parallel beta-helix repeat-containing protein [Actinomyces weissii]|uniref:Right-handed parallel beta-helix repeat-containing protein n=1 Tax=Actinomyces weissii TaxID=675090 RepID=A0A7T7MAR5_9ACTO|nr:right-handed parallel beta-helix repeat-containing protein [Actinomyces weissii]QQM68049.1 right-handed parallel beta-helix repeat-containing protein [Actinomyces weissii]